MLSNKKLQQQKSKREKLLKSRMEKMEQNREKLLQSRRENPPVSTGKPNKKYIEMVKLLDKVGFTPYDVLDILHTLPVSWEQYYMSYPKKTEEYMMDKLGDRSLFSEYRGMRKAKKTKRKSKGKGKR